MQLKLALCTALILCSQAAAALATSESALAIYQNSSTEIRTEQIAPHIRRHYTSMGINPTENSRNIRGEILGAIEVAFHPSHFEKYITRAFDSILTSDERDNINTWLSSPIGQKASLAEARAMIDSYKYGIPSTIEHAQNHELPDAMVDLIKTVEMAAMESDLQLDITVFQTSASAFAANAPQSQAGAFDFSIFYSATNSRRTEISSLNKNFSRSLLTKAYAGFDNSELESLIRFYGSPTGTRYADALRRGINEALFQAGQRFESEVKSIVATNSTPALAVAE